MFQEGDQTHKVDVWSLFVTMLYAGKFRQRSNKFSNVDSAIGNRQPERTCFCSTDACQVLRRSASSSFPKKPQIVSQTRGGESASL